MQVSVLWLGMLSSVKIGCVHLYHTAMCSIHTSIGMKTLFSTGHCGSQLHKFTLPSVKTEQDHLTILWLAEFWGGPPLEMPKKSKVLWLGWCPASWIAEDIAFSLLQGSSGFPWPGRKVSRISRGSIQSIFLILFLQSLFPSCRLSWHMPGEAAWICGHYRALLPCSLCWVKCVLKQGWDCHLCQDGTSHQRANPATWAATQVRQVPLCGTDKLLGALP